MQETFTREGNYKKKGCSDTALKMSMDILFITLYDTSKKCNERFSFDREFVLIRNIRF